MGEMRVLGSMGDMKISWDKNDEEEVEVARETFDKMINKGWSAFRDKLGLKGEKIETFDPDAGRIVLVPPIAGGAGETD